MCCTAIVKVTPIISVYPSTSSSQVCTDLYVPFRISLPSCSTAFFFLLKCFFFWHYSGIKFFLWLFSFELYFLSTFYYWIEFWRDAMNVQGNTRLYEHAYLFYILFLYIIVLHVYISCMFLFHVSSTGNLCVFLSMGIYLTEIVKILSMHELYGILILYMSLNVTIC